MTGHTQAVQHDIETNGAQACAMWARWPQPVSERITGMYQRYAGRGQIETE